MDEVKRVDINNVDKNIPYLKKKENYVLSVYITIC